MQHTVSGRPIGDLVRSALLVAADRVWSFGRIVLLCFLVLSCGVVLAFPVYKAGVSGPSSWVRVIVLALWILALALLIRYLADEGRRRGALERLMKDGDYGWLLPLLLAVVIFFFAATGFAALTQLLQEWDLVNLRKPHCAACRLDWEDFFNFYTWHFADAIPLLKIPDTLNWEESLVYEGAGPGWLVLGLQASVILPLIQTIRSYWKLRSTMPRVRVDARPRVVRKGAGVTVSWALSAPPPGYVFDVYVAPPKVPGRQRVGLKKDEEATETLLTVGPGWDIWQRGVTDRSTEYHPAMPGRYRFQARWRKATEDRYHASNTPRTVTVTVNARARKADARETIQAEG
jgi:hypothetical protein